MPVTRDADFPAQFAQLMEAMNAVCDGHSLEAVEQASANMLSAAIHNGAKMREVTDAEFPIYARRMVEAVFRNALENWQRKPQPSDVPIVRIEDSTMTVTIADQIKCVRRELAMRQRVYTQRVGTGLMKQADADRELAAMQAVHDSLTAIAATASAMPLDQTELRKAVSFELAEIICGSVPAQGAML
jgi:hypothetical protein